MARDYQSVMNGEGTVERPNTAKIGVDNMVRIKISIETRISLTNISGPRYGPNSGLRQPRHRLFGFWNGFRLWCQDL